MTLSQPRATAALAGRRVVNAPKLPPTAVSARCTPWQPTLTGLPGFFAPTAPSRCASGKNCANSTSLGSYFASASWVLPTMNAPQSATGATRFTPPNSTGTSKRLRFRYRCFMVFNLRYK